MSYQYLPILTSQTATIFKASPQPQHLRTYATVAYARVGYIRRPQPDRQASSQGEHYVSIDETFVQLLTPEGARTASPHYDPLIEDLTLEDLRTLYRDMALVRRFDMEATSLQRQGQLALWPPLQGQEAAQIGSGRAAKSHDFIFPSYREHGVAHTRGLDLVELLRMFRGREHGGWDPKDYNFHLYTMVLGSQPLHAAGYAQGVQRDGAVATGNPDTDEAVIVYFGDGATSQGDVNEAMVFAAASGAPLVFFCQNNQWAISTPQATQSRTPLYKRGHGFGIPSVQVDGNDVLAVLAVTREAMDRARNGGGPTFIEAYTYRMGAHTTSDDPTRYRTHDEEDEWRAKDPITRMRAYLTLLALPYGEQAQAQLEEYFAAVDAEADALGERTRAFCRSLDVPDAVTMFDHVTAEPNSVVDAERAWFTAYHADDATEGAAR